MSGWIKLHRSTLDHPRASDPEWVAVWIYLLVNAAHKPGRVVFDGKVITLKPGQLLTGRKVISKRAGVEDSKVKRLLLMMEREGQIDRERGRKGSVISISNWAEYQAGGDQQNDQQNESANPLPSETNEREKNEVTSRMTNKRPANDQQSDQQNDQLRKSVTRSLFGSSEESGNRSDQRSDQQNDQQDFRKVTTVQEGKNKNIEDTNVSSRPSLRPKKADAENAAKYQQVADAWNELNGLPKVERLTDKRKASLRSRLSDLYWRENWQRAMKQIPTSDFLTGRKTKWRATFDWFIRPESVVKIIEGQYHDGTRQPTIYSDSEKY